MSTSTASTPSPEVPPSASGPKITLVRARREDADFIRDLFFTTRSAQFQHLFRERSQYYALLASQFSAQAHDYQRRFPQAKSLLVKCQGAKAGRVLLAELDDGLCILELDILPVWQNRGIGRQVMLQLQQQAQGLEQGSLYIDIDARSDAAGFLERCGFILQQGTDTLLRMRWDSSKM